MHLWGVHNKLETLYDVSEIFHKILRNLCNLEFDIFKIIL